MKESEFLDDDDSSTVYVLKLFVNGTSAVSIRAINNLNAILEKHLRNNYQLEIVDAYQQPLVTLAENVTAIPMLIKKSPAPVRRLVGDMSDEEKVLKGLGLS